MTMTAEEAAHLRKENQELREALKQTQELLRVALLRIEELDHQKTPLPAFVKAKVKKPQAEEKKQRKKREARHNHGRPRSTPTQIVEHRLVTCPDCQLRLGGISLARVREVHGVEVSIGEIVEVLHRLSKHAQPVLDDLKAAIRASPAIQADETGWREDGENGYIWSVSTPTLRYYAYHHSRAGEVVKQLIGENYQGVLGSDFYAGYNIHQGFHQRCWAHYLRDIHKLKEKCPEDEEVLRWAKAVKDVYDQAVAWIAQGPDPGWSPRQLQQMRVTQQQVFEQQLWAICQPYVRTTAPQQVLCQRVEDFLPELFVFVAVPGVPAHNNLAERSVRPLVIARKISGGSRSPKGSQTRMGLASLFGTWMAQGLNPFSQCLALLTQPNSLGQV